MAVVIAAVVALAIIVVISATIGIIMGFLFAIYRNWQERRSMRKSIQQQEELRKKYCTNYKED